MVVSRCTVWSGRLDGQTLATPACSTVHRKKTSCIATRRYVALLSNVLSNVVTACADPVTQPPDPPPLPDDAAQTIELGWTWMSADQVADLMHQLKQEWPGNSYDFLRREYYRVTATTLCG